jgi:hypothetical protein
MFGLPFGMLKCLFGNELHPSNAHALMLMTAVGIDTSTNELHPRRVCTSILVTEEGIDTVSNELHPSKAPSPMLVTEVGINHPLRGQLPQLPK